MSSLDSTFGALFIGVLCAVFLQGVLSVQAYIYHDRFPNDRRILKILVVFVWIVDFIHLVLICQTTYHYLVTNWGNKDALLYSTLELKISCAFIGISAFPCQLFFLHRIWVFSNRNVFLVGSLLAGCLTNLALELTMSVKGSQITSFALYPELAHEIISLSSISTGVDISIAVLLSLYLRGRRHVEQTNRIVTRLIQYSVSTSLVTSLCTIVSLVIYLARPHTFIYMAIHFSSGRLYTNALLANLNSRQNLRMMSQESAQLAHNGLLTVSVQQDTIDFGSIAETTTEHGNRSLGSDDKHTGEGPAAISVHDFA